MEGSLSVIPLVQNAICSPLHERNKTESSPGPLLRFDSAFVLGLKVNANCGGSANVANTEVLIASTLFSRSHNTHFLHR